LFFSPSFSAQTKRDLTALFQLRTFNFVFSRTRFGAPREPRGSIGRKSLPLLPQPRQARLPPFGDAVQKKATGKPETERRAVENHVILNSLKTAELEQSNQSP